MIVFPKIIKRQASTAIVTWADGAAEELAAMLAAADAGRINLSDYWSIGDERTVSLNAIAANSSGAFTTAMAAQDVVMVLMNEGYMSQSGIHYVVGQKDCLNQYGRMTSADVTNEGSWGATPMRTDLNNLYYNAFADSDFKGLFKDFTTTTIAVYNGSTLQTVTDKVALSAEKEIFGSATRGNTTEAAALSQFTYYETAANLNKKMQNSYCHWWERSPVADSGNGFCEVYYRNGNSTAAFDYNTKAERGITPFCCI